MASVGVCGVGPGIKAADNVELFKERTHELIRVVFGAKLLELAHNPRECRLDVGDGALGIVAPLLLEALVMLDKFLSVELCNRVLRADRPRVGHEPCHAESSR